VLNKNAKTIVFSYGQWFGDVLEEGDAMKDYDENVRKVMDPLSQYGYSDVKMKCYVKVYKDIRAVLEAQEPPAFLAENARAWCKSFVPKTSLARSLLAVDFLDDIYQHGRILGSHLRVPLLPTDYYSNLINSYLNSIEEDHAKNTLETIRRYCIHFCCFAQYNGAKKIEDIDYTLLNHYVCFLREGMNGHYLHSKEGIVSAFLLFYARKGQCRIGHSLFMPYAKTGRTITMDDLSPQVKKVIEERRTESQVFPPNEFYALIPDFVQRMKDVGYSSTKTSDASCFLKCFYLFIDIENLGYDRILADAWVNDVAPRFFGTVSGLKSARRTFEMFEDYTSDGELIPGHYWRHTPTGYDVLPSWYKRELDQFTEDKRKEGRTEGTIRTYEVAAARFYRFLATKGIDSFEKLTPDVVKQFGVEDSHQTLSGKSGIQSRLKMFLAHLEFRHVIQEGLHYAVTSCPSEGDRRIVKTCTEEDRRKIQDFCANPSTPRQIRDAAILRIGTSTGMRSSDVLKLRWEDIDFQKGCARFIQSKTGVPHIVNLDVASRNALFVYLRDVRPKNLPHSYLFVSLMTPHNPLSNGGGSKAMEQAGVMEGGYRKLRKTYATDEVAAGATVQEAAQKLGHSNTSNIHKYVVLDGKRMRLCPLSMKETGLTLDRRRYTDG
jgi:site-specific recombinase XerD